MLIQAQTGQLSMILHGMDRLKDKRYQNRQDVIIEYVNKLK